MEPVFWRVQECGIDVRIPLDTKKIARRRGERRLLSTQKES